MVDRFFVLLVKIAICGLFSLFIGAFFYFVLAILGSIIMIPVSIIAGEDMVTAITNFIEPIGFKIVYAMTFICLMMEEMSMNQLGNRIKNWWKKNKTGADDDTA